MNKHLVKVLSALVVLSANTRLFAQSESTENPTTLDYNIPSPNAAGISRYGSIPVNLFTGIPGISIPLYNINAGNHTLPISISYHASGIKNNDISSDAGLGWSLSAGYTISRTIRGGKDEMGYVGHNEDELIVKSNPSVSSNLTIDSFRYSAKGLWDTQPDEFSFNIAGASGKFVMSPDKIIIMPDQDIKIDYTSATGNFYFVLTDAKGVKYYFDDISTSSTTGCGDAGALAYASTWYVSKIIYPDTKDSLLFTYVTESLTLSNTSESKNYDYGTTTPEPVKNHTCLSSTAITEKKISQIDFPFGKVKFMYNKAKLEISGSNALGYFEVFDKQNISVQKTNFAYSYYNGTSGSNLLKKLKLDSVYTTIASGETDNKHIFSYNGTNIAAYQAKSQDHWGYYNGATNTSMVPGNTFRLYDATGMPFYVPGGNREPNATYSGVGVLNKIQYPTGGTTTFEFENNDYGYDCEGAVNDSVFSTTTKTATANCLGNTSPFFEVTPVDFTVSRSQATSVVITSNTYNCTGNTRKFTLKDLTTNTVIAEGMVSVPSVDLVAGHNYRLTAEAHCEFAEADMLDCEEFITAKISYQTFSGTINKTKLAGGLRVKTITDYDPQSGVSNVRKYEYQVPSESVRSSGVLMYKPKYDYLYHYDVFVTSSYIRPMTSFCFTSEGNNSPQNNDYVVGYQYVKEITGASGEGGSTLYNYGIPYRHCDAGYPFVPYTSTRHRNGQLLSATVYDNLGQQLRKTSSYYSYLLADKIKGWKASYSNIGTTDPGGGLISSPDEFVGAAYDYISEKIRLDSTVTEKTLSAAATITKQGFTYLNSSAYYPYLTTTKNSDGIASTQTVWRSGDFTVTPATGLTGVTAALKFMITNHLTDYPVEIFTKAGSQVTGGTINEYALNTGKINPAETFMLELPSPTTSYTQVSRNITTNVATLTKDSKYTSATKYTGYNEKGNPAALSAAGNKQVSLVWGYGKTLPIAKMSYAGTADLAATSFEADAEGNWTYDPTGCSTAQLLTGKQSFNLTGKNVTRSTVAAAGNYIVSYWRRSGTVTVNSAAPGLTGTTINGWTYCEHRLTDPASITVSGTTYIDELRFYPENAAMTSYTHNPLFGITTLADQNNNILYYEYDGFGRLKTIKDQNGKILNQYTYTIQGAE